MVMMIMEMEVVMVPVMTEMHLVLVEMVVEEEVGDAEEDGVVVGVEEEDGVLAVNPFKSATTSTRMPRLLDDG